LVFSWKNNFGCDVLPAIGKKTFFARTVLSVVETFFYLVQNFPTLNMMLFVFAADCYVAVAAVAPSGRH